MEKRSNSLYIHIPFCEHLCSYCDFCKIFYNSKQAKEYLACLKEEINSYDIKEYQTIYIGGGTPSSLSVDELEDLLLFIRPLLKENGELTVECNIENTTKEKLLLLKKMGVTRLSFGVQSFHDEILKLTNRHHDQQLTKRVIKEAKEIGFNNINVDLIYGFKEETFEMLKEDLMTFLDLKVQHISIYSLTVHEHTVLGNKSYPEQDEDNSRLMYDLIYKTLTEAGYHRYEVSNFAKPGYESKHNQTYWRNDEYIGVGIGAHGYYQNIRYENTHSINAYLKGKRRMEEECVSSFDKMLYEIMLRLRTEKGIDLTIFKERYDDENYNNLLKYAQKFIDKELLLMESDHLKCSYEGMMILDFILRELFFDFEQ